MHDVAILLLNLGSPHAPESKYLKPYLSEFLMDERVIDLPLWVRTILVKGIIVPFRASKSAAKYKSIWTEQGSPLVVHTQNQRDLLQERTELPVYYSMRYGNPSAVTVLEQIHAENPGLKRLIVFPLYPHYAMSSYETAVEQIKLIHASHRYESSLQITSPYYNHPSYINALSESIAPYLSQPFDHVLFSYHGMPERHLRKRGCNKTMYVADQDCCGGSSSEHYCYRHQVITTTHLVSKNLALSQEKVSVSFQSRLGRDAWLKPYTADQLTKFPSNGIKKLLIVCPAFVSDCLETLEEIQMEGKGEFLKAGGESFTMIPALNESTAWIDCIEELAIHGQAGPNHR